MGISELRRVSAVFFGNQYRLELLAALALASADQGVCLSLLGECCSVKPAVYYPPVKAMAAAGLVQTTGRVRRDRRVLYARMPAPVWTAVLRMVEDLPVDVDLAGAAVEWPVAA